MKRRFQGVVAAAAIVLLAVPGGAQNFSDSYSFLKAVKERDVTKATDLITTPGSVVVNAKERATGEAAVHIVTRGRDLSWLSFLVGKGAKVDAQTNDGLTPLAIATQIGWVEGVQYLLSRRASVDLANKRGETPLIIAVQNRDVVNVRQLLAMGADPKKPDRVTGYSAIDFAKRDNRSQAILRMLETSTPTKAAAGPNP